MENTLINTQQKRHATTHKINDTKLTENKANSDFMASIKKITHTLANFFAFLFKQQSTSSKNRPEITHRENHNTIHNNQPVNEPTPCIESAFNNNLSPTPIDLIDSDPNNNLDKLSVLNNKHLLLKQKIQTRKETKAKKKIAEIAKEKIDKKIVNDKIAREITREIATIKLEKGNMLLINNDKSLSDADKDKYYQISKLGVSILRHDAYLSSGGIFRVEGSKSELNKIIEMLNTPGTVTHIFQQTHKFPVSRISNVYKRLASELLKKTSNIDFQSPDVSDDLQACDNAVKNKENIIQQIQSHEQLKGKEPAILKNCDNRITNALIQLAAPPLALKLITRLCAVIAIDEDSHRMSVKNLATMFAPQIVNMTSQNKLDIQANHDLKVAFQEAQKAKEINQLAESYISALIYQERSQLNNPAYATY